MLKETPPPPLSPPPSTATLVSPLSHSPCIYHHHRHSLSPTSAMDLKSCMITLLILVLLFAEPGSSKEGLDSEVYDIDYRGPETHSQRPPPKRTNGNGKGVPHINFKNHPRSKRQITQNKLKKGKKLNK